MLDYFDKNIIEKIIQNSSSTISNMSKADLETPLNLSNLAGRGVLITGGASGLGAAMAKAFAKAGYTAQFSSTLKPVN